MSIENSCYEVTKMFVINTNVNFSYVYLDNSCNAKFRLDREARIL